MTAIAIFTEQRCWPGANGFVYGRKVLGALLSVSSTVKCTVVARATLPETVSTPILPHQAGGVLLPWPTTLREVRTLACTTAKVWSIISQNRAVAVYCPGVLGSLAGLLAVMRRKKLVVIAVGNPREALSADVLPGLTGCLVRGLLTASMRFLCSHADVTRYVTLRTLQQSYPPGQNTSAFGITDVGDLTIGTRRTQPARTIDILTVVSLDQPYKGVSELIEAVKRLRGQGYDVKLTVAGTGRLRDALETASTDSLGDASRFLGHISGASLQNLYAASDMFVLASWTEGLPRALVEAMAAGLPCVATAVGGVPELLEPNRLVPPRNTDALVEGVVSLLNDSAGWATSSDFNIMAAMQLTSEASAAELQFVQAVQHCLGVNK